MDLSPSRGRLVVRRLLVFVVGILAAWLGPATAAVAMPANLELVHAYTYDSDGHAAPHHGATSERGPPDCGYTDTAYGTGDRWSCDSSARLETDDTPAPDAQTATPSVAQDTRATATTKGPARRTDDDPSSFASGRVAANTADDVVDLGKGWRATSFGDEAASFEYHFSKHGVATGVTRQQYADDALRWARNPAGTGKPVQLKDGTAGLRYRTPGGGPGGILDGDGNIITYWYR
jgi:hypothetical protein